MTKTVQEKWETCIVRSLDNGRWKYQLNRFTQSEYYRLYDNEGVSVDYECDLDEMRATIRRYRHNAPDEIIATKSFKKTVECVKWVAEMLIIIQGKLQTRLAPFEYDKTLYQERANQPIII